MNVGHYSMQRLSDIRKLICKFSRRKQRSVRKTALLSGEYGLCISIPGKKLFSIFIISDLFLYEILKNLIVVIKNCVVQVGLGNIPSDKY